jgi:cytochrome c-type biogenesis protein CcmH
MKNELRSVISATLMLGLLLFPVAIVSAQETQKLSPEVIAILGEPDAPENALDADVVAVLGSPAGVVPGSADAVGALVADIGSKLRCPVCQGVAISDSPAGMAVKMRGQVKDLVTKGYNEEQILTYFERSYGEFVRLEPPMRGLNLLVWLLPVVVLLAGAGLVIMKARRPTTVTMAGPATSGGGSDNAAEVDPALAKYLERIRRDSGTAS